jgi:flagellar protein FliT
MEQHALVDRILAMTLAIEHAVALADWTEAARLTEQRSPLFVRLTREQDGLSMEKISRIRAIDAKNSVDATVARTELQTEYSASMHKAQAASKYHQAARF